MKGRCYLEREWGGATGTSEGQWHMNLAQGETADPWEITHTPLGRASGKKAANEERAIEGPGKELQTWGKEVEGRGLGRANAVSPAES